MAPTTGYLLLADISGYTSYLAGVELDHAHGVLTDLLETIIARFKPLLTISKLEGDAVFGYVPADRLGRGETLFELVEATYGAFRDRVEGVRRQTTCTCNACRAIPMLDLKFIVHYGAYMLQTIAGIHELVGSDVNLVHRLLKNHVGDATGWKAYALFTNAALEQLGLPCNRDLLHVAAETYEHLGEVETYSLDLRARFDTLKAARHVVIAPEQADVIQVHAIAAPPAFVWDWANDPHRRAQWMKGTVWSLVDRPGGRTGAGARNHCAHGKQGLTRETVLDWQPFDYFTVEHAPSEKAAIVMTVRLEPRDNGQGTRLTFTARGRVAGMPRLGEKLVCQYIYGVTEHRHDWANLARRVAEAYAEAPAAEPAR